MYKSIITYLALLPLAILISLSCPLKQEVRLLLDIPVNTSAQTDNYKSSKVCLAVLTKDKESQKRKQYFNIKVQFLRKDSDSPSSDSNTSVISHIGYFNLSRYKEVPIFLLFRKLII